MTPLPSLDDALSSLHWNNLSQLVKVGCETQWSVQQMEMLLEWIFVRWQHPRDSDDEDHMWIAVWQIAQTWSSCLVYAAAVYQRNTEHEDSEKQKTFLDILYDQIIDHGSKHENKSTTNMAMTPAVASSWMLLSLFCKVLDRCCGLCCNSSFTHEEKSQYYRWFLCHINLLHEFSMGGLRIRPDEWNNMIHKHALDLCEFKTSCTQILELIYDNDNAYVYIGSVPPDFDRKLLQEATRLNDIQMPPSSFSVFSLSCLRLLVIKNHHIGDKREEEKLVQFLKSTPIISHVTSAVVQCCSYENYDHNGIPSWTLTTRQNEKFAAFSTLQVLYYQYSPTSIADAIAQHPETRQFLEYAWNKVLRLSSENSRKDNSCPTDDCEILLFLHEACRPLTRQIAHLLLSESSGSNGNHHILTCLFEDSGGHDNHFISLESAVLLKVLLADRLYVTRHDELSRLVWQLSNDLIKAIVESLYKMASSRQKSQYYCNNYYYYFSPILLALLDVGYILIKVAINDAEIYSAISPFVMHAHFLESLVEVASPKRTERVMDVNSSLAQVESNRSKLIDSFEDNDDQSTPPLNNLSYTRLDVSSVVAETEKLIPPRGMDCTLRLSAATLLAAFAQQKKIQPENYGNAVVLQNRALDAANKFVADLQLCFEVDSTSRGFYTTHRRLRLLTILAAKPENERYLAGLVQASEIAHKVSHGELHEALDQCQQKLKNAIAGEKQHREEKEKLSSRLNALAVKYQREKSELHRHVVKQSENLVEIHVVERKKAESRSRELAKHMAEAQKTAILCREAEAQIRSMYDDVTSKLQDTVAKESKLIKRAESSETELRLVSNKLRETEKSLSDITRWAKDLQRQLEVQIDQMATMDESQSQLRESLENLFGDMVSLAQLYEVLEKQQYLLKERNEEKLEKLQTRLENERQRNTELEERERRILHENEIISKKYLRAKERLEEEQNARVREAEQRRKRATGPVSYINNLHKDHSKISSSTSDKRSHTASAGKENGSSRSS
jgi:hypothetical protein